jgi:hypothetical protein
VLFTATEDGAKDTLNALANASDADSGTTLAVVRRDGIPRPERRRIKPAPSGTQRGSCGLCTNFICWLSSRPRTS